MKHLKPFDTDRNVVVCHQPARCAECGVTSRDSTGDDGEIAVDLHSGLCEDCFNESHGVLACGHNRRDAVIGAPHTIACGACATVRKQVENGTRCNSCGVSFGLDALSGLPKHPCKRSIPERPECGVSITFTCDFCMEAAIDDLTNEYRRD